MKLIHLADLHIGKRLCGYSLIDDQAYVFERILEGVYDYNPDAILIAGDVFDRSVPSEDAIKLYDTFVSKLAQCAPIYIISGNHDSGVRLELYKNFLKNKNIYISGHSDGIVERHVLNLKDEYAHIYLLPYISPAVAREIYSTEIKSFQEAIEKEIESIELDPDAINILVSHQFYLNHASDSLSLPEGSERTVVGGLDDISAKILKDFDYVALGHIHRMVNIGNERIRYAGSPLKYSVNESDKYLNRVEVGKDKVVHDPLPLKALRDVREIRGSFKELATKEMASEDYVSIRLVSETGRSNVKKRLLEFYPNLLNIIYEEKKSEAVSLKTTSIKEERPIDLLERFVTSRGYLLEKRQRTLAENVLEEIENETT